MVLSGRGLLVKADNRAWGFWETAAWVAAALILLDYLFPKLEHLVLDGTTVGKAITDNFALGALNSALVWIVPILLLIAAVWIRRLPVRSYFAWVAPRPGFVLIALATGAALQVLSYAVPYLLGVDMTSAAAAQYRAAQSAGLPVWLPLLLTWPGDIAAPLVEESIFRGFLWRGWGASRLGARGTWLLTSLVFAAYHIEKVIGTSPFNVGFVLVQDLLLGLLLGWLRWRSGGTFISMAAHLIYNVIPPIVTFMIGAILVGHLMG